MSCCCLRRDKAHPSADSWTPQPGNSWRSSQRAQQPHEQGVQGPNSGPLGVSATLPRDDTTVLIGAAMLRGPPISESGLTQSIPLAPTVSWASMMPSCLAATTDPSAWRVQHFPAVSNRHICSKMGMDGIAVSVRPAPLSRPSHATWTWMKPSTDLTATVTPGSDHFELSSPPAAT